VFFDDIQMTAFDFDYSLFAITKMLTKWVISEIANSE
jgi:hypothetical protein